jgi:hypothetical protein
MSGVNSAGLLEAARQTGPAPLKDEDYGRRADRNPRGNMIRGRLLVLVLVVLAAATASCSGAGPSTTPTTTASSEVASAAPSGPPESAAPSSALETPAAVATVNPSAAPSGAPSSPHPRPSFDSAAVSAYLTGKITLLNLADADLGVTVTYIDPASGQSEALGTYAVPSFAQQTYALPPASYRLDFGQPPDTSTGPRCTIVVKDGQAYSFVAVPGAIAISRAGHTPANARDLFVATSSLCRK